MKDAELDTDNGKAVYEIETVSGTQKTKVKIDANTGEVLETQQKTIRQK
ncbi:PepSY domain-containing protein [Pasteurella multocida]|nr:PepSY domain-containing protein [Pasteurella multocida]URK01768.1 PepSY domain-containing protein [Pasteurella multocida]HDR1859258.1 PepSY domain-containing protein [Pasteurella multocida]HDR1894327.1 PepSY domain-containing protein [Pasteurella multocida]